MLQPTRINPKLSAYTYLYGEHNYDVVPLVPLGWKALCFNNPAECQTWAPHGTEGFYIGPAPDNCHCYKCYIPATGQTHNSNTIVFYLTATYQQLTSPIPELMLVEAAKKLGKALTEVAQNNPLYDTLSNFKRL